MSKPDDTFQWATAPGATLEPASDEQAAGFATGQRPPARWHNWLFNGAHQWFGYLSNLHGEAEFLNKAYSWTGMHRFSSGYVANNWGVQGEVLYVDETGGLVPKTRTMLLDVRLGHGGWEQPNLTLLNEKAQAFPFPALATGMIVTKVTVSMRMGVAAASANMFFRVRRNIADADGTSDIIDSASVYHSGAAFGVDYVIVDHIANYPIDNAASWLELYAMSADTASSAAVLPGNQIGWVKLEVSVPGP
jgi:hypothetical protein